MLPGPVHPVRAVLRHLLHRLLRVSLGTSSSLLILPLHDVWMVFMDYVYKLCLWIVFMVCVYVVCMDIGF